MPLDSRPLRRSGQTRVDGPQARTSALMRASELRGQLLRSTLGTGSGWQSKVIKYDRDGPGVVGYYLDTVALLASLCPLVPEQQDRDGKWRRSDDPVLNVVANGYRSPLFEQHDLVAAHVRAREGVGEAWVVWSEDVGWHVATVPNVTAVSGSQDGAVQWTDLYGITRKTSGNQVYRSWVPDPWQPWLPTSPVRRALPNIRRIHSAVRSQIRAADSRLVMNGLLAFPDENEARPLRDSDADGPRDGIDDVIADYMQLATKAFTDDDSVAATVPFPYLGQPAVPVDLGRNIDQYAMPMEDKGIEGFARDVNFPAQLLTSGPGTSNHWNEWLLAEIQQKMGLAPKLIPVCSDITTLYFRPMIRQIRNRVGAWDVDPGRVRLAPDYTFLASKPDKAGKAIEAFRAGIITRDECLAELGFTTQMSLPHGLDEYEHWQIVNSRPGAPYIEVDADGNMVVPEPPPPIDPSMMGGGMGGGMDGGMGGMSAVEGSDSILLPEEPTEPASPFDTPTDIEQGPPQGGPPIVAALGDDEAAVEATLAQLVAIDATLATQLEAVASAAALAATTEVAKAIIRAYPPRDPRREELRALPVEEVWAAADPSIRSTVDVESVAAEALAPYRTQIEELLDEARVAIEEAFDQQNWSIPEILVAAAAVALLAGVAATVVGWMFDPAGFTRDAVARAVTRRALRVPPAVINAAMMVAGGAAVGLDGLLIRSAAGTPVPAEGGPFVGGTGTATGHNAMDRILNSPATLPFGTGVALKWRHGVLRTPKQPFPPHVALDGLVFDNLGQVPGGYFPQDHNWCSCVIQPTLTRREYEPPVGLLGSEV